MNRLLENRTFLLASAAAGFLGFAAAFSAFLHRLPAESIESLGHARILPLLGGLSLLGSAFVARAVRLNQLLPDDRRLSLVRGTVISAAANVLYNVVPFRAGEVFALALYRRESKGSWGQSAGLMVLIKVVDISTALLAGVTGAVYLLVENHAAVARGATLVFALGGALGLALLPHAGLSLCLRLLPRLQAGSRRHRLMAGLAEGLQTARERPRAYLASFVSGVVYLALHLTGVQVVLASLGFPVPIALVAAATVTSVTAATAIPSPAGTFGSSEAGFAAALAAYGIPLTTGFVLAAAAHLAILVSSGLLAAPTLVTLFRKKGVP